MGDTLHTSELNGRGHRLARHPSETAARIVQRALALAISPEELTPSGAGVCDGDTPTFRAPDLWVEVGRLGPARVERALRRTSRLRVVSCDPVPAVRAPRGRVLEWWRVDAALVDALAADLARREAWGVHEEGDVLVVEREGARLVGALERQVVP